MALTREPNSLTIYGWLVCCWVLILSFQYGFHVSALNQLQAVLTCKHRDEIGSPHYGLPTCIPMSEATFSVVTSVYTVGGLVGSLCANLIMDGWGRKGATRASAFATVLGAGMMGFAGSIPPLIIGRLLVGVGAGFGICVGPIYLSEITPVAMRGSVGVLTQLAIVIGIFVTQAMGLQLATPHQWRIVLFFSAALSIGQLVLSVGMSESPAWLARQGVMDDQKRATQRLWGVRESLDRPHPREEDDLEDPLLAGNEPSRPPESHVAAISVPQLLKAPELRRPLYIVSFAMISQQVSGINAVLYYSNDILSKTLPELGPYVSLGITVVNVLMTFPPIILIERMGRRKLLSTSILGALASLVLVGIGIDTGVRTLSSVAIMTFIMSFAIGLGPVPFVMVPEVSPFHAVSALSSVALSLNWISNFFVGLVFLPLRNLLAQDDPRKEGNVFFVFVGVLFCSSFALSRVYRG